MSEIGDILDGRGRKRKNINNLVDMCCPECNQNDRFNIAVEAWASVTDDGTEDFSEVYWDDNSSCVCPDCGFTGKVGDFKKPEDEPGPRA